MVALLGGVFLGWSLGANHAANCFGSAVASRMVRFWTAAALCAACVVLGALLEGQAGIETLKDLTQIDLEQAVVITVAAAITVTDYDLVRSAGVDLPGGGGGHSRHRVFQPGNQRGRAGQGRGLLVRNAGGRRVDLSAALQAVGGYLQPPADQHLPGRHRFSESVSIVAGSYASYTLGANNVANATAVFVGAGMLTVLPSHSYRRLEHRIRGADHTAGG